MTLQDFTIGQTVCLHVIEGSNKRRSMRKDAPEKFFVSGTVEKVGRKYVEVNIGMSYAVKFDSTNNFRQGTDYSPDYELFLSREDAEREENRIKEFRKFMDNIDRYARKIEYEDLVAINEIISKYVN